MTKGIEKTATVGPVDPATAEFDAVCGLYRANSSTLGFLPRGALTEFAAAGNLVALVESDGSVIGYASWRHTASAAVLVHLCVDGGFRRRGFAGQLLQSFIDANQDFPWLKIRTREDYKTANSLWPQFGFIMDGQRSGRGADGVMTFIWKRFNQQPNALFSEVADTEDSPKIALDANVFFDLISPDYTESDGLRVEWFGGTELCVTAELLNEISRNPDPAQRERALRRAKGYKLLEGKPQEVIDLAAKVVGVLPPGDSDSDGSDWRQLAHASLTGADTFCTRDGRLLAHAENLEALLQLRIARPCDLVVSYHAKSNPSPYQPIRLAGTAVERCRVQALGDLAIFQDFAAREKRAHWEARLRSFQSRPERFAVEVVKVDSEPRVAYCLDRAKPTVLKVEFIRALSHPSTATLLRRALAEILDTARRERCRIIVVGTVRSLLVSHALADLGFQSHEKGFARLVAQDVVESPNLSAWIQAEMSGCEGLALDLGEEENPEKKFWPLKVTGRGISAFVVPIAPAWAEVLFDQKLAAQTLFPPPLGVSLALENVYYSASKIKIPDGSRILWYVSGSGGGRVGQVRACSVSLGTEEDEVSALARRFHRLGALQWRQLLKLAGGDPRRRLRLYRFAFTELFDEPVPFHDMQSLLRRHTGKQHTIPGPLRVPEPACIEMYRRGFRLAS